MDVIPLAIMGGLISGAIALKMLRPVFAREIFTRENYRGKVLPTSVGLVIPIALLITEAVFALVASLSADLEIRMDSYRLTTLVLAVVLGFLGVVDDLVGTSDIRGFRGHLNSLIHGQMTTGGLKLIGGGCIAIVVCAPFVQPGTLAPLHVVRDGALVGLTTNLANLFDRAPGRVLKFSTIAFVLIGAVATYRSFLVGPAIVFAVSLILISGDLKEQFMLGDTGANVLGGVIGFSLVIACPPWVRLVALVVVLGLNLAAERISFSEIINRFGPLRALDELGQIDKS